MKKAMVMVLVAAMGIGAMGIGSMDAKAYAGDREWAVAGKVLTGLLVLEALTTPRCSPPVVYQPQVVYQPPVTYCPPPVVYQPQVVYPPQVIYYYYTPPMVYRQPVWTPPRPAFPHRPVTIYRNDFDRGRWGGSRDDGRGWRR